MLGLGLLRLGFDGLGGLAALWACHRVFGLGGGAVVVVDRVQFRLRVQAAQPNDDFRLSFLRCR